MSSYYGLRVRAIRHVRKLLVKGNSLDEIEWDVGERFGLSRKFVVEQRDLFDRLQLKGGGRDE